MEIFVNIYNAILTCITTILDQFKVQYPTWLNDKLEIEAK